MGYDPNQPRAPKGTTIGGQWVKAAAAARKAAGLEPDPKLVRSMMDQLEAGGFSLTMEGVSPVSGYMTAIDNTTEFKKPQADITIDDLLDYAVTHYDRLTEDDMYMGGWVEEEGGVPWAYIDISKNIQDLEECMQVARETHQIAIYDVVNEVSIYVEYDDDKKQK